jgi:type IV pilus assembly protein PilE
MRRTLGFTLIELMIAVVVIAVLTAIAYPSYVDYVRRGHRAQGQQFLLDLAQRQEQYLLDNRAYATVLGAGGLGINAPPAEVAAKYNNPIFTLTAGPPPTFRISMAPLAGGTLASDGTLLINSAQVRWRETDGNNSYDAPPPAGTGGDCPWDNTRCRPTP